MSTPIDNVAPLSTRSRAISPTPLPNVVWTLLGVGNAQAANPLTVVHPTPFTIGRKPGCTLQLNSKTISSHHADLHVRDGQLILVDRDSTNGTFVNGQRITNQTLIKQDDLIQFADIAFRVRRDDHATNCRTVAEDVCDRALALVQFDRMMENRLVTPFFQPIVSMQTSETLGYEVLARSRLFGLETSAAMFDAQLVSIWRSSSATCCDGKECAKECRFPTRLPLRQYASTGTAKVRLDRVDDAAADTQSRLPNRARDP